jgi:hypothetical protein
MARLPSMNYLVQQIGGDVIVFEDGTEREVVRFPAGDPDAAARAQKTIYDDRQMSAEDKCFAHFWCGYFHAHASHGG